MPQDTSGNARGIALRMAGVLAVYFVVTLVVPRPANVTPEGWRLTGLFLATIAGLMLHPLPGGAIVLLAITLAPFIAGMKIGEALSGFGDPTLWLVMAAFFISRALLNTGLARRIALFFVRWFGKSSLGVAYSLAMSDCTLAGIIPSNAARSGGVVLPILRSIAELYDSQPGETARRLGAYLIVAVYQSICVTAAMFFTGQASNPLAAQIAGQFGFDVTWAGWFAAGVVPGFLSLAIVPWVVMKLYPPEIRHTPRAREFASGELRRMGPMTRQEWMVAAVFVTVCAMWVTSGWHKIDITITALCGGAALLLTGTLTWEDVVRERAAWDIFIWYGGLLRLGKALNDAGSTTAFAQGIGGVFAGMEWPALLALSILIYFYAHYAFASITAHILAMFPAFLALLAAKGAPLGIVVFGFACSANLAAGLTNYGTTPSPMFFAHGYVPFGAWWRIGAIVSVVNLLIWGIVGVAWWKVIGLW
jgi:DASS family divalent anion:Na+ symporter